MIRPGRTPASLPVVTTPSPVPGGTAYLVRHGLANNPRHILYGWLPRVRLAEAGLAQAEAAGRYLADRQVRLILTSPLLRAIQTTRVIAGFLPSVPVRRSALLIEGGLPRYWQGMTWEELPERHPAEYRQWREAAGTLELGESMAAQARRMQAALALALRLSGGAPAVCVSHRDPILSLRLAVQGRSFNELHNTPCAPGSVTIVQSDGRSLRLVEYVEPSTLPVA